MCMHVHVCVLCVGGVMIFMGFQASAVNMCVALGYQHKTVHLAWGVKKSAAFASS